jgi:hypothetical protein
VCCEEIDVLFDESGLAKRTREVRFSWDINESHNVLSVLYMLYTLYFGHYADVWASKEARLYSFSRLAYMRTVIAIAVSKLGRDEE